LHPNKQALQITINPIFTRSLARINNTIIILVGDDKGRQTEIISPLIYPKIKLTSRN